MFPMGTSEDELEPRTAPVTMFTFDDIVLDVVTVPVYGMLFSGIGVAHPPASTAPSTQTTIVRIMHSPFGLEPSNVRVLPRHMRSVAS